MTTHLNTAPLSFGEHFDAPLPRGIREEAFNMPWDIAVAEYGHTAGPLRLGQWECTDASRSGPQARNYQATIAVGDRIATSRATASGPIAALTAMLYERGIAVEILKFHQLPSGEDMVTFVHGTDGAHAEWAMGSSEDTEQSALRAVIACANRLSTV
ncbi:hypothetical protein BH09ACT7_BH09ACT7_18730 [soil metagenome]